MTERIYLGYRVCVEHVGRLLIEDWATKAKDSYFLGRRRGMEDIDFFRASCRQVYANEKVDIRICARKGQLARKILRRKEHVTTKIQPSGGVPRAIEVANLRIDHSKHSSSFCMARFNRVGSS
jgi:hypothetical protein